METLSAILIILFSWPAITLYVAVTALIMFRGPIAKLIDRIKRVKVLGTDWDAATEPPEEQKVIKPEQPPEAPKLEPPAPTEGREELKHKLEAAEKALERYASAISAVLVRFQFERVLNSIFGTQLAFLRSLASTPGGKQVQGAAMIHFVTHQQLMPAGGGYTSMNLWAQWLIDNGFIVFDGQTIMFELTGSGYNFVGYANDNYGPGGPWRNG